MDSTGSLAAKLLSATLMFDQTSLAALEALAANSDRRILRRGEVLVREGDRSDRFFVVLSGRFTVHREGIGETVAEIGQGELVGEIGFFAALPRIATVVAARDSIVLEIRDDQFERAAKALPSLRQSVTTFLARRFAMQSPAPTQTKQPCKLRTLAIVPASRSRISPDFISQLRAAFSADKRAVFLTRRELEGRFAGPRQHILSLRRQQSYMLQDFLKNFAFAPPLCLLAGTVRIIQRGTDVSFQSRPVDIERFVEHVG